MKPLAQHGPRRGRSDLDSGWIVETLLPVPDCLNAEEDQIGTSEQLHGREQEDRVRDD
jgi:hypothetical protein